VAAGHERQAMRGRPWDVRLCEDRPREGGLRKGRRANRREAARM